MSRTLAGLLREFNIEVVDNSRSWCRGARQTCAGKTLARIFKLRGYDHLRAVAMSIVETKPNKHALISPIIWGISDVLYAYPDWFGDTWLQAMDDTDLVDTFQLAARNRRIGQPRCVIATLIFQRMRPHFPDQVRAGARRRRHEDEPTELAAA